jgi:hypothetical protein
MEVRVKTGGWMGGWNWFGFGLGGFSLYGEALLLFCCWDGCGLFSPPLAVNTPSFRMACPESFRFGWRDPAWSVGGFLYKKLF